PRELVSVVSRGSFYGDTWGDGSELSYPMYTELRDRNQVFAGMFARFSWEVQAKVESRADRVVAEYVTGNYFPLLGVKAALGRTILDDPRIRWAVAFGRLRPGISLEEAQTQLQPLYAARIASEVREEGFARASETQKTRYLESTLVVRPAGDGRSSLRQELTKPLWILMAVVGVVLLIACA